MSILDDFPATTVSVQTYAGADGDGMELLTAAVNRDVFVEDKRRQVRSSTGELTTSETTVYDTIDAADAYAPGSRVTVNGRVAVVIVCARNSIADDDVDHVQVALT